MFIDEESMDYLHTDQSDLEETVWFESQETWLAKSAELLEEVGKIAINRLTKRKGKRLYVFGTSKFAWLVYIVRLAYLKGYAAGEEYRSDFANETIKKKESLSADSAFKEFVKSDDFEQEIFDCAAEPGKATYEIMQIISALPDLQEVGEDEEESEDIE